MQLGHYEGRDGNGEEDCRGLKDRRVAGKKGGEEETVYRGRIVTRLSGGFVEIVVYIHRYFCVGV